MNAKMKHDLVRIISFVVLALALGVFVISLTGCNRQVLDNYSYDYAIIQLPNGDIVEGDVQSWKDYEDGDQIQVKIDGINYLVHSSNVVLEDW